MKPRIYIDRKVYNKIMHFVDKSDVEVSGMGKLVKGPGWFRIIDAIMLPQSNTATTTDLTPEGMAKAEFLLKDQKGELNFWWHSHVNMAVFWSGTDTSTIQEIGKQGYLVATVFNKLREMRSAVHYENPYVDKALGTSIFIDELPTVIYDGVTDKEKADWDKEYDSNIIAKPASMYSSSRGYSDDNWRSRFVEEQANRSAGFGGFKKGADGLGNAPKLTKAEKRAARQEMKKIAKLQKKRGATSVVDLRTIPTKTRSLAMGSMGTTKSEAVNRLDRLQAKKSMGLRHFYLMEMQPHELPSSYMGHWIKTEQELEALQDKAINGAL